jgi:hypothetical protein
VYIYIYTHTHTQQYRGQDRTMRHPGLHYPWHRHFVFHQNTEFSIKKKRANEIDQAG